MGRTPRGYRDRCRAVKARQERSPRDMNQTTGGTVGGHPRALTQANVCPDFRTSRRPTRPDVACVHEVLSPARAGVHAGRIPTFARCASGRLTAGSAQARAGAQAQNDSSGTTTTRQVHPISATLLVWVDHRTAGARRVDVLREPRTRCHDLSRLRSVACIRRAVSVSPSIFLQCRCRRRRSAAAALEATSFLSPGGELG
jgi:hypothetical protein